MEYTYVYNNKSIIYAYAHQLQSYITLAREYNIKKHFLYTQKYNKYASLCSFLCGHATVVYWARLVLDEHHKYILILTYCNYYNKVSDFFSLSIRYGFVAARCCCWLLPWCMCAHTILLLLVCFSSSFCVCSIFRWITSVLGYAFSSILKMLRKQSQKRWLSSVMRFGARENTAFNQTRESGSRCTRRSS